ncbi:MAG: hypothetical protein ACRER2_03655, partial [Methylococcales bacterium]
MNTFTASNAYPPYIYGFLNLERGENVTVLGINSYHYWPQRQLKIGILGFPRASWFAKSDRLLGSHDH